MIELDEIINIAEKELKVNISMRKENLEFLNWQKSIHPEYDLGHMRINGKGKGITQYPWANLLIDKLLLFNYLCGEIPITTDKMRNKTRIGRYHNTQEKPTSKRILDLTLLGSSAIGAIKSYEDNRTDHPLYLLYSRTTSRKNNDTFSPTYQNWQVIIDEVGSYSYVKNYFGRQIDYKKDVCQKKNKYKEKKYVL